GGRSVAGRGRAGRRGRGRPAGRRGKMARHLHFCSLIDVSEDAHMRGKMDCQGLTDRGRKRESNEDQFLVADLSRSMLVHQTSLHLDDHTRLFGGSQGHLLLVADGMGGHAAGERASSLAVDALARYVLNTMPWF